MNSGASIQELKRARIQELELVLDDAPGLLEDEALAILDNPYVTPRIVSRIAHTLRHEHRKKHFAFDSTACAMPSFWLDLERAIHIAAELSIYAYDAYLIVCAQQVRAPLLTLDRGLARSARRVGVTVLEVP